MKKSTIMGAACALPLVFGSVAAAQGAQEEQGQQQSPGAGQQESEQLRQQDPLRGSQAGTQGEQRSRQQQQQAQPSQRQQQPGAQQQQAQPQGQGGMQQRPGQQQQAQGGQQGQQRQQQQQQAQPGQEVSFQSLDQNGDGALTRNELRSGVSSLVTQWDIDQDGNVSSLEMTHSIFASIDQNRDQALDDSELQTLQQKWLPEGTSASLQEWDLDRDGKVSFFEVAQGFETNQVTRQFDRNRDQRITEREIERGLLQTADRDGNGRIDEQEWPMG